MDFIRRFRVAALVAVAVLAASVGFALSQTGSLQIVSPTGSEQIAVNVPASAYNNFVLLNQIRNASGYQLLASASGTIAPTNAVNSLLVNAQPASGTIFDTPSSPFDGETFQVCNVTGTAWATNTVTLAAASGSSLNTGTVTALTTLAAHTCEELQFDIADTTWFQIR
jgi:hypothetical protein